MTDPGAQPYQPQGQPPPPNHLAWAILATIFCCLPLGIPAIVFSAQVNGKWQAGDFAGAQDSSNKAKQFAPWGTIVGGVINVLVVIIYVVAVVAAVNSGSDYSSTY